MIQLGYAVFGRVGEKKGNSISSLFVEYTEINVLPVY